jgi:hypothetical protein
MRVQSKDGTYENVARVLTRHPTVQQAVWGAKHSRTLWVLVSLHIAGSTDEGTYVYTKIWLNEVYYRH